MFEMQSCPAISSFVADNDGYYTATNVEEVLKEIQERRFQILEAPTGFENRGDSDLYSVQPSYAAGPDELTVTLTRVSDFSFFVQGLEIIKTATDTVVISAPAEGVYWIYYDSAGTLTASVTPFDFADTTKAPVAVLHWDDSNSQVVYLGDERHGTVIDSATHSLLHDTVGTRYESGLTISGYVLSTDTNAAVTVGIAEGILHDEDIVVSIVDDATPDTYWEQDLSDPAKIPIFYRDGAVGNWRKIAATDYPFHPTGSGRLAYDNVGVGVAEGTNNYYIAYWIFATNDINNPIISIMGQREDFKLSDAKTNNNYESLAFGTLPFQEMKVLYRIILQTKDAYTNAIKSTIEDVADYRALSTVATGTYVANSHSLLSDLTNDDHAQYLLADGTRALTGDWAVGAHAISGITTLGMTGQLTNTLAIGTPPFVITSTDVVANLNVDMVDGYHLDQGVLIASTPTFGGLTINGAMLLNGAITGVNSIACDLGTSINEFSTDDTLAGDSDDAVPTEQAVKAYADVIQADVDGFNDELKDLTQVEIQQLELIGATTISAAQWGYLGALDQALTQASSPTFAGLTINGAMLLNGAITGVNSIACDLGTSINEFSTDGTLAGDSDDAVATEKATKTYVDTQVATVNSLAEILALGNEADGTDLILDEGADLIVYSDDKVTEKARIDGATGNITTVGTVDGVDVAALKTDVDGFNDELKDLTQVEIQQLELIDATTISGAQWGYLGALDQALTQASSPTFVGLTLSADLVTTSTIDGVDVAGLKTDVDGFNDELKDLTQVEIQQLELIDAVTISNAQWAYLGALDQALTQASSPTFVGLTLSGAIATPTTITTSSTIDAGGMITAVGATQAFKAYRSSKAIGAGVSYGFWLDDITDTPTEYVRLVAEILDTTDGSEDGQLDLFVMSDGTVTERATLDSLGNLQIDGDLTVSGGNIDTGYVLIDGSAAAEQIIFWDRDGDADSWAALRRDKAEASGLMLYSKQDNVYTDKPLYLYDSSAYQPALYDNFPDAVTLGNALTASGIISTTAITMGIDTDGAIGDKSYLTVGQRAEFGYDGGVGAQAYVAGLGGKGVDLRVDVNIIGLRITSVGAASFISSLTAPGDMMCIGDSVYEMGRTYSLAAPEGVVMQIDYSSGNTSSRAFWREAVGNLYGGSIIYAADVNPVFDGTTFTTCSVANTLYFLTHSNSLTGTVFMSVLRGSVIVQFPGDIQLAEGSQIQNAGNTNRIYFNYNATSGIGILGAATDPGNDAVVNLGVSGNALHIFTNDGSVTIGPQNASWCHIYTDRTAFYMNKALSALSLTSRGDMLAAGRLTLTEAGSGGGILCGGDAHWYRSAANKWYTPDAVHVNGVLSILSDLNTTGSFLRFSVIGAVVMYADNVIADRTSSCGGATSVSVHHFYYDHITASSVRSLKENIKYLPDGQLAAEFDKLKPASFNFIGDEYTEIGFIADDMPVSLQSFNQAEDDTKLSGYHPTRVTVLLVDKIRELEKRLVELEAVA